MVRSGFRFCSVFRFFRSFPDTISSISNSLIRVGFRVGTHFEIQDIQRDHGLAYLFISHDLAIVEHLCQRIVVRYLGRVVESGPAHSIGRNPQHPDTQVLRSAVPTVNPSAKRDRILLSGDVPSPIHPPSGCPFHPRCPVAESRCRTERPEFRTVANGHEAACHRVPAANRCSKSNPPGG